MSFEIFCNVYLKYFFILRRIERDMIEIVYWSSCKIPLILVRVQKHLNFLDRFSKNTQIPNFMKIRPVGDELFRADGRTGTTKLIVIFRNFSKAPKNFSCDENSLIGTTTFYVSWHRPTKS
jgi:hypothetical protein